MSVGGMNPMPAALRGARLALVLPLVALTLATLLSGCVVVAAGAAGAGAVAYVRGDLESNVPASLDDVFRATQRALGRLEFARISEKKSSVDAVLVSRTALDKKIEIKLERTSDQLTQVRIRVGLIGDESLSLAILDKINAELR
jgi:hypothetical protein